MMRPKSPDRVILLPERTPARATVWSLPIIAITLFNVLLALFSLTYMFNHPPAIPNCTVVFDQTHSADGLALATIGKEARKPVSSNNEVTGGDQEHTSIMTFGYNVTTSENLTKPGANETESDEIEHKKAIPHAVEGDKSTPSTISGQMKTEGISQEDSAEETPDWQVHGAYLVAEGYIAAKRLYANNSNNALTFVTNVLPNQLQQHVSEICARWQGPMSVSVFGFDKDSMDYVNNQLAWTVRCNKCVSENVTFHIIFPLTSAPDSKSYQRPREIISALPVDCKKPPSIEDWPSWSLPFPRNLLYNVARQAAKTPYVLMSNVLVYPSRDLQSCFALSSTGSQRPPASANIAYTIPVDVTNQQNNTIDEDAYDLAATGGPQTGDTSEADEDSIGQQVNRSATQSFYRWVVVPKRGIFDKDYNTMVSVTLSKLDSKIHSTNSSQVSDPPIIGRKALKEELAPLNTSLASSTIPNSTAIHKIPSDKQTPYVLIVSRTAPLLDEFQYFGDARDQIVYGLEMCAVGIRIQTLGDCHMTAAAGFEIRKIGEEQLDWISKDPAAAELIRRLQQKYLKKNVDRCL